MTDTLTPKEIRQVVVLGRAISTGLSCDVNGKGLPCLSDRTSVLPMMADYLRIHGYKVTAPSRSSDA